jgi:ankyrin repeat protein
MPPPQLSLEILLMIAHLLTDDEGKLCFADFNSFLKVNRALYACLKRTLWKKAVYDDHMTVVVFTHVIRTNDLTRLKFFLELDADIETVLPEFSDRESDYWKSEITPLKVAAILDNVPMARLLLEYGANTFQYDKDNEPSYSAIHAARSAEMVQLLLDHHVGPEQEVVDSGLTPLHFYSGRGDVEAMRVVLRRGVEVILNGGGGASALHYAAERDIDAVKLLLEYGADVKEKDFSEETPLHWAAEKGKADVVRLLLEVWPEGIREKNADGYTPLHSAVSWGKTDVVGLLLELWPEGTGEKNRDGHTPLHLAAFGEDADLVRLLLERGPEATREKNLEGDTPLHLAAHSGEVEVVKLLLERWPEAMREKDLDGDTPLHLAALQGNIDAMRLLVERWPEGKRALNGLGQTPLVVYVRCLKHYLNHNSDQWEEIIALLVGEA